MSINKIIVLGILGKDPDIRQVNDTNVVNFSVACSESYKDKTTGEYKEITEWIPCRMWSKNIDFVQKWIKKGCKISIEGKFKTESYEKDGFKHYKSYCLVDTIRLEQKAKENSSMPESDNNQTLENQEHDMTDNLPF